MLLLSLILALTAKLPYHFIIHKSHLIYIYCGECKTKVESSIVVAGRSDHISPCWLVHGVRTLHSDYSFTKIKYTQANIENIWHIFLLATFWRGCRIFIVITITLIWYGVRLKGATRRGGSTYYMTQRISSSFCWNLLSSGTKWALFITHMRLTMTPYVCVSMKDYTVREWTSLQVKYGLLLKNI